jgi:FkbM family methyltransferase
MMNKGLLNKYFRKFGFEVHGTGYLQSVNKGSFKDDPFKVQKEIIENCSTIFDIGANRGEITSKYTELFPEATIFAFEPFPDSFKILESEFSTNKRIECFQKALGAVNTKSNLFVNRNVDTNSLLSPIKMGLSSDQQVKNVGVMEVEVCTIDEFCRNRCIDTIDILKLDIQGSELSALRGASGFLRDKRIKLIYTETYFKKQYENQPLFHDLSKFLEQYGYYLQDFYNPIYGKGDLVWCDVIFK